MENMFYTLLLTQVNSLWLFWLQSECVMLCCTADGSLCPLVLVSC